MINDIYDGAEKSQPNPLIPISFFAHVEDKGNEGFFQDINGEMPWFEFGGWLFTASKENFAQKPDAPLFSPTVYKGTRSHANATTSRVLVLDSDGGLQIERFVDLLNEIKVESIIYTSARHKEIGADEQKDKFRVIILLNQTIHIELHKKVLDAFLRMACEQFKLTIGKLDGQWDLDRSHANAWSLFYVPGTYATAGENIFEYIKGDPLDPAELLAEFPEPVQERTYSKPDYPDDDPDLLEQQAEAAIKVVPNNFADRADWVRIGMALKSVFAGNDGRGFELWREFSLQYPGNSEAVIEKEWKSYRPYAVTAKTIFHYADKVDAHWREQFRKPSFTNSEFVDAQCKSFQDQMAQEELDSQDEGDIEDEATEQTEQEPEDEKPAGCARPEPMDIFGTLTHEPRFNADMLPKALADFVYDQSELLGVDPGAFGIVALVVMASLTSDNIKLQPRKHDTTYTEAARLWAILIGHVGNKKTPMLEKINRQLRARQADMKKKYDFRLEEYKAAYAKYEVKRKAWLTPSGENTAAPEKPEKPIERRLLTNDFTVEALALILRDNPRGILLLFDEIMMMFGGFDAYKSGKVSRDRPKMLEGYNGGGIDIDRVNREERLHVPNWSYCIVGGIQYAKLDEIGGKLMGDGLLERFIMVPMEPAGKGVDRKPNMDALMEYGALCDNLIDFPDEPILVKLSPEAAAIYSQVEDLGVALIHHPGMPLPFHGHAAKFGGLWARIALTMHVIEQMSCGRYPVNRRQPEDGFQLVAGSTAQRAYELVVRYIIPHAIRQYDRLCNTSDQHQQDIRWIAGFILATKRKTLDLRDCQRANKKAFGKENKRRAEQAIRALQGVDWLIGNTVNPRVHELFEEQAEQEKRTRNTKQQMIDSARKTVAKVYQQDCR